MLYEATHKYGKLMNLENDRLKYLYEIKVTYLHQKVVELSGIRLAFLVEDALRLEELLINVKLHA
jgi:hypothetical protein